MGYRSDVVIALHKDILPSFLDVLCANEETKQMVFECNDEYKTFEAENEEGHLYVRWHNIKWYDSYPEVSDIMEFLNEQECEMYRFVRGGEEGDDIEEQGDFMACSISVYVTNCVEGL